MKNTIKYLLLLVVVGITGCETGDSIVLPNTEKLLNAQSLFRKDKKFEVIITEPIGLGQSGDPVYPDDCNVEVIIPGVGSDLLKWVKGPNEKGSYISNSQAIEGIKYLIVISKNGFPSLTAENSIPTASNIESDSVELNLIAENALTKSYLLVSALKYTPPLTDESYHFFLMGDVKIEFTDPINGNVTYRNEIFPISKIKDVEKNSIVSFDKSFIISGNNTNETLRPLSIEGLVTIAAENEKIVEITWTLQTASKEYYLYINSINTQVLSGNNPLETPSPLFTNFKNGSGIFAGYSEQKITQTIN